MSYRNDILLELFIKYIKDGREDKFYNSWAWRKKRLDIIESQNNECQLCKQQGRVTLGAKGRPLIVHHIKHVKQWPALCMADDNLLTVCGHCHNTLHPEKNTYYKSHKNKLVNKERW